MNHARKVFALSILSFFGLMSGCSNQNPMMNEKTISGMKENLFLDAKNFPIRECSKFYAGNGDLSSKAKCDDWTQSFYKGLIKTGDIPSKTTLEDFRNKNFWLAVETKN